MHSSQRPLLENSCVHCPLCALLQQHCVVCPWSRPRVCAAQMWAWNKVALLQKVLRETPPERAPWILYMQPDTIIDEISFSFPFEMYQDKHWVSVGNAESVINGWASGKALPVSVPLG